MAEAIKTGAEVAHEVGFPPFNAETFASQLFWLAVTFAFLYWFVSKIALPRIAAVIADRKQRIDTDLDDAARLKAQADEAFKAYEAELATAKANARSIAEDTRARLSAESDARRKSLEQDLSARIAAAEKTIADTKTQALTHVGEIAGDAASAIVERILGSAPTAIAVDAAVKSALDGR
ncbi:F-type H+-transporting ATPase subunit b [Pseudochelatococcus lubricantis]|uniref:ATP synthase subunit b n=1 Tax=Pseudochelatococcus lubricantis TaxID=1538102 RepID=A0ABX0UZJ7_9HYPH|nr:ATP F0F1 synthase subunit B [Pseudochelatococcus lubricantis]NIJ57279.1 F-type H+-transporting ATPase subunit b [Pseudochelatococcus lubricantis]